MPFTAEQLHVGCFLDGHHMSGVYRFEVMEIRGVYPESCHLSYRVHDLDIDAIGPTDDSYFYYTEYNISDSKPQKKSRYKPEREYIYGSLKGGPITPIHRDATPHRSGTGRSDAQALLGYGLDFDGPDTRLEQRRMYSLDAESHDFDPF